MSSEPALILAQQQKIAELEEYQRFAARHLPYFRIKRSFYVNGEDCFVALVVAFGEDFEFEIMRIEHFGYASFFFKRVQTPLALSDFRLVITKSSDAPKLVVDLAGKDVFCVLVGRGYIRIRFFATSSSHPLDPYFCKPDLIFSENPYALDDGLLFEFPKSVDLEFERNLREFLNAPLVQKYVKNENIIWK